MTPLACAANRATTSAHEEDAHEERVEESLLADWARELVLKHEGPGSDASPEQRAAYDRAMMLYHGTQHWDAADRTAHAAVRAEQLGYPEAAELAALEGGVVYELAEAIA